MSIRFASPFFTRPPRTRCRRLASVLVALALCIPPAAAAEVPFRIGYQGAIEDDQGQPVDGVVKIDVRIYDERTLGTPLYMEEHAAITVTDGVFDVEIGGGTPTWGLMSQFPFHAEQHWLELVVDDERMEPRQRLLSVPYALRAAFAENTPASAGAVDASSLGGPRPDLSQVSLLRINTDESHQLEYGVDGASIYWDDDFFGTGESAMVFLKDDASVNGGDGAYVFAHETVDNRLLSIHHDMIEAQAELQAPRVIAGTIAPPGQTPEALRVEGASRFGKADGVPGPGVMIQSHGGESALYVDNRGSGDFIEAYDGSAFQKVFWVGDDYVTNVRTLRIHGGADLSERFDVRAEGRVEPGTVVSIDTERPGKLVESALAYDTRVAGIVAGAGGVAPGMVMAQDGREEADGAYPVALTGRVYARADTSGGPIRPGDLLTTSERRGHAMRVADRERASGAILGKAMTGLDDETGLVLVLVNLQ